MNKLLLILSCMMLLLILGCSSSETGSEDAKETITKKSSAADPTAGLSERPNSYCVTYSTFLAVAKVTQEFEFCQADNKIMSRTDQSGFQIQSFCVDGAGSRCMGSIGKNKECFTDNNMCTSLKEPFADFDLSYNSVFYDSAPERNIAGLRARCYRVDVGRAANMINPGSDIPEALRYANLCYHPQFKMLLFYDFNGITTEVKSFVTPSPAEKFMLPKS